MLSPKAPELVIVQNRETQFDAPLYALIHQQKLFRLQVIYTTASSETSESDDELGFAPQWDHLQNKDYPHRILSKSTPFAMWKLAKLIRKNRPRLVVIFGYYPRCQLWLAFFLRIIGQRIGLRSDNTLQHTHLTGWRGRARFLVVGSIQRLFHTWHPVGEQAMTYLRTLSKTERPSYRFSYSVDNDWFSEQSRQLCTLKTKFLEKQGWPQDSYVILGIMKWTDREDPLTLVQAFSILKEKCSNARMILIGSGPLESDVNIAIMSLSSQIICPGYQPYSSLPGWYAYADVFVHPSPNEPWGVSVNEALACGVPVIAASGVGSAAELLKPGINGTIFSSGNVDELAQILQDYASDPQRSRSMKDSCFKTADAWHYRHTINEFQKALRAT